MIGELIDHYRVLELLGRGAMGVVYKALDENLDRPVALKVMSAEARNDSDFVERFRQEARLQGALNHANVAVLFDYFVHDGAPVAVMEFIDGESLQQLIRRRGPVPANETMAIFEQALRGVAAAHRAGIIHRDLKPSNLMLTRDGIVKVMDFGIAKRQGTTGATQFSTSIGTSLYMAPEQILGRPVDCRTDVYALGITLYELLTGQPPFNPRGKAEYLVLNAHVNELPEPPTVHCRDIPQPLVDAVMRALAKDPDERFQSADDFLRALAEVRAPATRAPDARAVDPPARQPTPSRTVLIADSPGTPRDSLPARGPTGTTVLERPVTAPRAPGATLAFEYSAATLAREARPPAAPVAASPAPEEPAKRVIPLLPARATAAPATRGPAPGLARILRERPATAAVLAASLLLATLVIHHRARLHTMAPSSSASKPATAAALAPAPSPAATGPAATGPPAPRPPAPDPATVAAPEANTASNRPDLSGTWRGQYIDASGKPLLRVVGLSISRVDADGGIEGTLQYEAASGSGECRLRPGGSSYSPDLRRLQLSPEACSAHYPKELSVPLDFDGVTPGASTLKDGRIEAPTGEVISVELSRVTGT